MGRVEAAQQYCLAAPASRSREHIAVRFVLFFMEGAVPASLCKTVTGLLNLVPVIYMLTDIKCTDRPLACIGECMPLSGGSCGEDT